MARPEAVTGDTPAASCEAGEPPPARLLACRSGEIWASGSVPVPPCTARAVPRAVVAPGPPGVAAARPTATSAAAAAVDPATANVRRAGFRQA